MYMHTDINMYVYVYRHRPARAARLDRVCAERRRVRAAQRLVPQLEAVVAPARGYRIRMEVSVRTAWGTSPLRAPGAVCIYAKGHNTSRALPDIERWLRRHPTQCLVPQLEAVVAPARGSRS
jgi:hypothetical protein